MDGKVSFARAAGTIISLTPSSRAVPSEPLKRVKAWKLAEAILRPAPRLPPDDWARANRIYPETSGLPGPRDPSITPYIVPVERAIHAGGGIVSRAIWLGGIVGNPPGRGAWPGGTVGSLGKRRSRFRNERGREHLRFPHLLEAD